jgi:Tfp pilus assembly protein PilN
VRALNLASQPFRNERLPVLLSVFVALGALGATLPHAIALTRILPSRLGVAEDQNRALESQIARIEANKTELRDLKPSDDQRKEWTVLRDLVDRRVFRWSLLLKRLNAVLPNDVHLVTVEPQFEKGVVTVHASATADTRGSESLPRLVRLLEDRPEFDNVMPLSFNQTPDGDVLELTMHYLEPAPDAPAATATPTPPEEQP